MFTAEERLNVLLRRRRLELGLSQAEIAEELHVSAESITMWESGRRRMDLSKLPRLAAVLEIDPKGCALKRRLSSTDSSMPAYSVIAVSNRRILRKYALQPLHGPYGRFRRRAEPVEIIAAAGRTRRVGRAALVPPNSICRWLASNAIRRNRPASGGYIGFHRDLTRAAAWCGRSLIDGIVQTLLAPLSTWNSSPAASRRRCSISRRRSTRKVRPAW